MAVYLELMANRASFGRSRRGRKVVFMRQTKLGIALCASLLLSKLLVSWASAAPNPDTNTNAILVDLNCGSYSVVAAGILQSHSPSFLVVSSESPAIRAGSRAHRSVTRPPSQDRLPLRSWGP